MEELASQADLPSDDPKFLRAWADAEGDSHKGDAATQNPVMRLVHAHRKEWRAFVDTLGAGSWINQQIGQV